MNRTSQMDPHDKLLGRWKDLNLGRGQKGFVKDGIIDLERWNKAKVKILLICKEAYSDPDCPVDWDERKTIRKEWKGPRGNLFWNAAYWTYAASQVLDEKPAEFPHDCGPQVGESLLSAAFINVKKSAGRLRSGRENIRSVGRENHDLIRKQVEIIDPDIAICGYTWEAVRDGFSENRDQLYDLVYTQKNRVFVDFWHPANRYPHQLNYYALQFLLCLPEVKNMVRRRVMKRRKGHV